MDHNFHDGARKCLMSNLSVCVCVSLHVSQHVSLHESLHVCLHVSLHASLHVSCVPSHVSFCAPSCVPACAYARFSECVSSCGPARVPSCAPSYVLARVSACFSECASLFLWCCWARAAWGWARIVSLGLSVCLFMCFSCCFLFIFAVWGLCWFHFFMRLALALPLLRVYLLQQPSSTPLACVFGVFFPLPSHGPTHDVSGVPRSVMPNRSDTNTPFLGMCCERGTGTATANLTSPGRRTGHRHMATWPVVPSCQCHILASVRSTRMLYAHVLQAKQVWRLKMTEFPKLGMEIESSVFCNTSTSLLAMTQACSLPPEFSNMSEFLA